MGDENILKSICAFEIYRVHYLVLTIALAAMFLQIGHVFITCKPEYFARMAQYYSEAFLIELYR